MWSIKDEDGPTVADSFYENLFRGVSANGEKPYPDTKEAAWSLHCAVKKLRDAGLCFRRWVPFIHMGL